MNQNEIQKAIETNNLQLTIDLRIEQNRRLEKLTPLLQALKERMGSLHTSATIAYSDKGQVKYINLPVYVTENAQERIMNLLFPAPVQLTIWEEEQEKIINLLEYHLDKRTEVVTEISGIADINDHSNVLIIPIDFTKSFMVWFQETQTLTQKYYENGSLFNKPTYIKYIWKEDYTTPDSPTKVFLIPGVPNEKNVDEIVFSSPQQVYSVDTPDFPEAYTMMITKTGETAKFAFTNYYAPVIYPDTFFLYCKSDSIISGSDYDGIFKSHRWETFVNALKAGNKPSVYLKTAESDEYYPASYTFSWNEDKTNLGAGSMSIRYIKEIDSKFYLCNDHMEFVSFAWGYYGPEEGTGADAKHYIQRFPLN